jgi:ligand-binding SRPBCC domain-containing protein
MRFTSDIWLPRPRDEVFQFFSEAKNLDVLTPPWLHFEVLTPAIVMCPGARIDYRLRLYGIPLRWQSEITRWEPPDLFVDEQRRGPYRRWVHTHTFADERGGTRVGDSVEFEVPLGGLVGWLVMGDVRRIFTYRQQALQRLFPSPQGFVSAGGSGPAAGPRPGQPSDR